MSAEDLFHYLFIMKMVEILDMEKILLIHTVSLHTIVLSQETVKY